MQSLFNILTHQYPDDPKVEFWFARDLQKLLGFARVRSKGDAALFGGHPTQAIKESSALLKALASAEDIKKLERRVKREEKKLEEGVGRLPEAGRYK